MRSGIDDPDLPVSTMMVKWPETAQVFLRHEMRCVGCLIGPFHTLGDVCAIYGLAQDAFLQELRAAVQDDR